MSQSTFKNYLWLVFERSTKLVIGLGVNSAVARHLGPVGYGYLAYALSVSAMLLTVGQLGLDAVVVKELTQRPSDARKILTGSILARLSSGLMALIALVVLACSTEEIWSNAFTMLLVSGVVLLVQCCDIIDLKFQSEQKNRSSVTFKLASYLVANSIKIALIWLDSPPIWFAATYSIEAAITALFLVTAVRKSEDYGAIRFDGESISNLVRQGFPFLCTGVAIQLYVRVDQIFIKALLEPKAMGIYAAAYLLGTLWQFLPTTLATALLPLHSRREKVATAESDSLRLYRTYRLFAALGYGSTLIVQLVAEPVVLLLYGSNYEATAEVLKIMSLSNVFISLGVGQTIWLICSNSGSIGLRKALLGAAVSVAGNFLFAENFGITGVVWISVAAQFASSILANAIWAPQQLKLQLAALLVFDLSRALRRFDIK